MRSIVLALAFAAPLSAVAATSSTFTSPINTKHESRPSEVYLTFVNHTSQDRELVVGDEKFKVKNNSELHMYATVGSKIRIFSETNSKIDGQSLMQISASDENRTVNLK